MAAILDHSTIPDAAPRIAALLGGAGGSVAWVTAQLADAEGILFGLATAAGEHTASVMEQLFGVQGTDMDAFSLRASEAARRAFADQARPLQESSLEAIDETVRDGYRAGLPSSTIARRVRQVVGLDAVRAGALLAYEDELRHGGMDEDEVLRLTAEERAAKVDGRGQAWALTANLTAAARGQLELWREQKAEGLIQGDFESEFEPDEEGEEGATHALVGTLFGPPAHPHCMCGIELAYVDGVFFRVWVRAAEAVDCDICDDYAGQMI